MPQSLREPVDSPSPPEPRPLRYLFGGGPARVWLTMAELAEHGKFPSAEAARIYVRRHPDLPHAKRGRHVIVDRAAFDRFVLEQGARRGR